METTIDFTTLFNTASVTFRNNRTVHALWHSTSEWFWDESWWLPDNLTWEDLENEEQYKYPQLNHLYIYPAIVALALVMFKYYIANKFILKPIAKSIGLYPKKKKYIYNSVLESVYSTHKCDINKHLLADVSRETGLSVRNVERWLRQRRYSDKLNKYDKFVMCGYEFIEQTLITILGLYFIYDKPFVWDISLCWKNHPYHQLEFGVFAFYMLGLGKYLYHFVLHSLTPGRKDKVQYIVHHICTIFLMIFSWILNFVRVGCLVLLVHECVDIFLVSAKILIYLNKNRSADAMFGVFLIVWCLTRTGLYPFWIMHSVFTYQDLIFRMPAAEIFKYLLWLLMILNVIWTIFIFKVIVKKVTSGELADNRSSGEESEEDKED